MKLSMGQRDFTRNVTHVYLSEDDPVMLRSHHKLLRDGHLFSNNELTSKRVNLAIDLYKKVHDLKIDDANFTAKLKQHLSVAKTDNETFSADHNKHHVSGVRFFGKGSFFQSQLGNTLSKALSHVPELEKAEQPKVSLKP